PTYVLTLATSRVMLTAVGAVQMPPVEFKTGRAKVAVVKLALLLLLSCAVTAIPTVTRLGHGVPKPCAETAVSTLARTVQVTFSALAYIVMTLLVRVRRSQLLGKLAAVLAFGVRSLFAEPPRLGRY